MARKSKEALIEELVKKHKVVEEGLHAHSWTSLNQCLKDYENPEEDNNDEDLTFDEPVADEEEAAEVVPCHTDPEWTKYALGLLIKREKVEKDGQIAPRTVGLRRLVALLIGPIVDTDVKVIQCPSPDNDQRATVEVRVTACNGVRDVSSSDAADVVWSNTPSPFCKHPVASASTKAEGRALKRLLGLNCYTAEEMDTTDGDAITAESAGGATAHQLVFLEATSRDKLGLNIVKFVAKYHPDCTNINSLKHGEMLALFEILNSYQGTEVPEELRGYDDGWRHALGVK